MTAAQNMVDRVDRITDMYFDSLTALVNVQRTWTKALLRQPMSLTPVQEAVTRLTDYANDGVGDAHYIHEAAHR